MPTLIMSDWKQVVFSSIPTIGSRAEFTDDAGRTAVSSPVAQVRADAQHQGWFWVVTASGSQYYGTTAQSQTVYAANKIKQVSVSQNPSIKPIHGVLMIVVGVLILAWSTGEMRIDSPSDKAAEAYYYAQEFVQRRLELPSTARFPDFDDPFVSSIKINAYEYEIHGYVDSENNDGAMLRTPWGCIVRENGNKWQLIGVKIEE